MPIRIANVAAATASVISDVSGRCCATLTTSRKKPCLSMWMPASFGTWSSTITRPMPALKPVSTGVEMKLATKPSAGSPSGTTRPSCVPARIASVVVELTLSTREEPASA